MNHEPIECLLSDLKLLKAELRAADASFFIGTEDGELFARVPMEAVNVALETAAESLGGRIPVTGLGWFYDHRFETATLITIELAPTFSATGRISYREIFRVARGTGLEDIFASIGKVISSTETRDSDGHPDRDPHPLDLTDAEPTRATIRGLRDSPGLLAAGFKTFTGYIEKRPKEPEALDYEANVVSAFYALIEESDDSTTSPAEVTMRLRELDKLPPSSTSPTPCERSAPMACCERPQRRRDAHLRRDR